MRHYRLRFGKSISVVLKLCCFETWRWFLVFFGAQTEYKVQKEYKCALILVSLGGGDFSSCKEPSQVSLFEGGFKAVLRDACIARIDNVD